MITSFSRPHGDGTRSCARLLVFFMLLSLAMLTIFSVRMNAQADPGSVGQWSSVFSTSHEAVHAALLPTGKVIFWSSYSDSLNPQTWDPATGTITPTPLPGYQLFCAGLSLRGDGQLLVTGGNLGDLAGVSYASTYDPVSNSWTRVSDMNAGRWYPTNTTLSNGDVLVVSGNTTDVELNTLPQVWQSATQSWRDLTTAQIALALYPRMFLAPNGKVFYATPESPSRYLDTSGTGNWTTVANLNFNSRDYDTAVMYAPGKILVAGGADPPTATAEVIDLNSSAPAWRFVGSMSTARRQLNGTILADGKVLITGGSSGSGFDDASAPVFVTEMWDSATEQFTPMASITAYRGYHSTAMLLPDGRVLSAGGDVSGATAEIFSPPYLFRGSRPTISSGPTKLTYGQTFSVITPDAPSITQANLIRLSSVTHSFNEDQRIVPLNFTLASGGLQLQAPNDQNLAPPGPYMLFILNSSGVPSVAQILQLSADLPPIAMPTAAPTSGVAPLSVSFSGNASVDPDGSIVNFAWDFGDGQGSSQVSPTHTYASPGTYTTKLTVTDNSGSTGEKAVFVTATIANPAAPALTAVSPSSGTQGATLSVLLSGNNFQSGATCSFGTGITVVFCTFASTSQLNASIVVNMTAPVGAHDVTVINQDSQVGTLAGGFLVNSPPSLTSITPDSAGQGQVVTVTLNGKSFQSGSECSFGPGTLVNSCVFNSTTQGTAVVSIRPTATLGARDVTITDPDAQSSTLSGGFSVTPLVGGTIHLDFNYPNRDALFAAGWDFQAKKAAGPTGNTEQTGSLAIDYNQTVHPGVIRVPILSGSLLGDTNNSQNTLFQDLPSDWTSIRLMIASFNPVADFQQVGLLAYQDDDNYVELGRMTDQNQTIEFYREQNAIVPDATVKMPLDNTKNLLLRLDRQAATNTYSGFFSLDGGSTWTTVGTQVQPLTNIRLAINTGGNTAGTQPTADLAWVEIIRPGLAAPPAISSVNPNSGAQGQDVQVVVSGSNFQSGAKCDLGSGITVNSCAFNSASQLTAALTITPAAVLGTRDLTVTNPDNQSATINSAFFVNAAGSGPVITSVSPNSGAQGISVSNVMLSGSNFQSGAQCDFGPGIKVNLCTFNSSSQLIASITIAAAAPTGAHNVTVTDPGNRSFTFTAGFSVTPGTLAFSPSSLSFNDQAIGTTSPSSGVVLTNNTPTAVTINRLTISGDFLQTNNCPVSLPTGSSCTVNVKFQPTTEGTRAGALSAEASPDTPQAVSLSGMGTGTPILSVAPTTLDFGGAVVSQQSAPQTVSLRVTGAPLAIQSIDFTSTIFRQDNQCPAAIAAGGQCSILVFFTPSSLGTVTATMQIQDDAAGSPQTIQLQGQGSHFVLFPSSGFGQTIPAGQTVTFSAGLKSLSVPNETVSLSCSGAPATTCSLSQSSFSLNGSTQMFTVSVATTAHSATLLRPIDVHSPTIQWLGALITMMWVFVITFGRTDSRRPLLRARALQSLSIALLFGLAALIISCGGSTSAPSNSSGTPSGQYVLTISGTSSNTSNPVQTLQLPFTVN